MHPLLRVLVVDDERPARSFLVSQLERCEDVTVVGAAASGDEALELIDREHPDLMLLDVQMPGLDGFGVVHMLDESKRPLVALVTAFEDYAEMAREVGAIDYLLKPVEISRLRETLACARQFL